MTVSRQGTVLIIIAGIAALLASLSLTFLVRMRGDVEESALVTQYAQAKIMLAAACNYVQETSRLGWDRYPSTPTVGVFPIHEETFGWVDVRDGSVGPRRRDIDRTRGDVVWSASTINVGRGRSRPEWPAVLSVAICPMYVLERPRYAISLLATPNAMQTSDPNAADYCFPLLRNPDPRPVIDNGYPGTVSRTNYGKFAEADWTPRPQTVGRSWFRVLRDGPATFVLTCGSGGTNGYRDWDEAVALGDSEQFGGESMFNALQQNELRLWYRIEWSAATTEVTYHNLHHEISRGHEHYMTWPPNASHTWMSACRTQSWIKNPVGTIRWIQRLPIEPTNW